MIQPRGSQLRICYDPAFTAQSAVNVPNNVNTLTAVLQVTARKHIRPEQQVDKVFDCSGQFLISKRVLSRIGKLSVECDTTVAILKGFLRNAMGAGSGVNLTMLTQYQFQQPFLTLAVGFADSPAVDVGVLFHSVVVNNIKILQKSRDRLRVSMDLVGSGDLVAATGLAWPACAEVVPIYSTDCALTLNSVDRMVQNGAAGTSTIEFGLEYSNNLLEDDAHQLADIDITRLERADLRTIMYKWKVEGYELDATHLASLTDPRTEWPVVWRIGTSGSNITLTSAAAILEGEDEVQGFADGSAGRAVLNLTLEPTLNGATLPIIGVATA